MARINTEKEELVICYHNVHEAVAMSEILTSHVRTENNFSDFMTKVTYGQKRRHLVGSILFDIYDYHSNKKSRLAESPAEWLLDEQTCAEQVRPPALKFKLEGTEEMGPSRDKMVPA